MALWAIAYDLDVKGMKQQGYTKSQVTQFYNSVRECLAANKFAKFHQGSLYTSEQQNSITDAFTACLSLSSIKDTDKFIKRLNLLRIEDLNDLLPLVVKGKKSLETDRIQEEIDDVFASEPEQVVAT